MEPESFLTHYSCGYVCCCCCCCSQLLWIFSPLAMCFSSQHLLKNIKTPAYQALFLFFYSCAVSFKHSFSWYDSTALPLWVAAGFVCVSSNRINGRKISFANKAGKYCILQNFMASWYFTVMELALLYIVHNGKTSLNLLIQISQYLLYIARNITAF